MGFDRYDFVYSQGVYMKSQRANRMRIVLDHSSGISKNGSYGCEENWLAQSFISSDLAAVPALAAR
jgi:hypothetical protein